VAERSLASGRLERTSGHGLYYSAHALGMCGEVATAQAFFARATAHTRKRGDLLALSGLLGFRGSLETECGDLLSAEQDLREGLELARETGTAGNVVYLAAWLVEFLLERGSVEEAASRVESVGLSEQVPVSLHFVFFLAARGKLRLELRQFERAL